MKTAIDGKLEVAFSDTLDAPVASTIGSFDAFDFAVDQDLMAGILAAKQRQERELIDVLAECAANGFARASLGGPNADYLRVCAERMAFEAQLRSAAIAA